MTIPRYRLYIDFGTGSDYRDEKGRVIPFLVGHRKLGMILIAWLLNIIGGCKVTIIADHGGEVYEKTRRY